MDKQPDELILQSLRQGSYDAFDALYMRYAPHVEAFAFCMLKNRSEAEDLAHDIFLKIWETRESIGRTDLPGGDYSWIMRSILDSLIPLGEEVHIYPGHGPESTIGHETLYNPFIVEVLNEEINYRN